VEIHTRQKLCHFGCYVAKAKLFCLESFVPVTRAGVFIWENFHPGYGDLGRKNRDLGNRASPASHMNPPTFLRRKVWQGEISETEPPRSQPGWPGSYEEAPCYLIGWRRLLQAGKGEVSVQYHDTTPAVKFSPQMNYLCVCVSIDIFFCRLLQ